MNLVLTREKICKIIVFLVFFCTYIFPTAEIPLEKNIYGMPKLIFIFFTFLLYILAVRKIKKREIFFIIAIVFLTIITKEYNYLMFVSIIFLDKVISYKEYIKKYMSETKLLYICLMFTIFYSFLYYKTDNRFAHTSIQEINQSGISIFCLGVLLLKRNKKIGIFTLLFGCLTFSRSYILALACMVLFQTKVVKNFLTEKNVKRLNYLNLTVISSIILFLLGILYIIQYKNGNIVITKNTANRMLVLFDESNFLRFTAIFYTVLYFIKNPFRIFLGISDKNYMIFGRNEANSLNIMYKLTIPHNLFFSHLKLYGIFSFFEIIYTSYILKKVTDKENFAIYIAIALYSIFLGCGFYSYWLYLSVFCLIFLEKDKSLLNGGDNDENNKKNNIKV